MFRNMLPLLVVVVWMGLSSHSVVRGQDDPLASPAASPAPITLTAYWENDGKFYKPNHPTDRYYTNGVGLSLTHQPQWAKDLAAIMPFAEAFGPADTAAGYIVGQQIFTPADTRVMHLQEKDRPYAGYLFAGVFWQRANENTLDHFQIDLGVVGPASLGEKAQKWVHEILNEDQPMGWDNQLGDEVTFQTYVRKKWKLKAEPIELFDQAVEVELLPQVGAALGTVHRYVEAGAMARVGFRLPDDFGPGRLEDVAAGTGRAFVAGRRGFGAYAFLGANGRAVEHNLFLEGNNFKSSHHVDAQPLIGQLRAGVALAYQHDNLAVAMTYMQTFETREFERQNGWHGFGAWTLSATLAF